MKISNIEIDRYVTKPPLHRYHSINHGFYYIKLYDNILYRKCVAKCFNYIKNRDKNENK